MATRRHGRRRNNQLGFRFRFGFGIGFRFSNRGAGATTTGVSTGCVERRWLLGHVNNIRYDRIRRLHAQGCCCSVDVRDRTNDAARSGGVVDAPLSGSVTAVASRRAAIETRSNRGAADAIPDALAVTAKATPARTTRFTTRLGAIGGGTGALRKRAKCDSSLLLAQQNNDRQAACQQRSQADRLKRFSAQLGQACDRALGLRRVGLGRRSARRSNPADAHRCSRSAALDPDG